MNRRRQRRREAGRGKSRTVTHGKTAVEKKWMWNNRERHRLWRTQARVFHVNASSPWQRAAGSWTALMRRTTDRKSKNILPSRRNPPEKVDCSKSSSGVCTKEGMFPFFPSGIPVVPHPYRHLRHFEDSWVCLLPRFPNRYLPPFLPSRLHSSFLSNTARNLASYHWHHRHLQADLSTFLCASYPTTSLACPLPPPQFPS